MGVEDGKEGIAPTHDGAEDLTQEQLLLFIFVKDYFEELRFLKYAKLNASYFSKMFCL